MRAKILSCQYVIQIVSLIYEIPSLSNGRTLCETLFLRRIVAGGNRSVRQASQNMYDRYHKINKKVLFMKKHALCHAVWLAGAAFSVSVPSIAIGESARVLEEVVVTARRREERLQDVPISMTMFSQEQMDNANIVNAGDLATYTPSLSANNRFGDDSTNFAIRGFSQELRTTASVAVYFAEVVAPRGANTTQSGDGAGPGDLFDLENIQVLKGPQGTLFGRNTTGGAVLLTPKKPTDEFGGYAEVSAGNFDMKRAQGVLNLPISDTVRLRLGVDHQKRDGYLDNISGIGPSDFSDMDYTAARASLVWDITDNLENYTIAKWSKSENNGAPFSLYDCNPGEFLGPLCQGDLDRRIAGGHRDHYDIYNFLPDSSSEMEQWQVINTTTWEINDNLRLKNIASYAEFESRQNTAIYGTDWRIPTAAEPTGQLVSFQQMGSRSFPATDQKSMVEELQLAGESFDERLSWQVGVYYEKSKPMGEYGSMNPSMLSCDQATIESKNPQDWRCNDLLTVLGAYELSGGAITALPAMPGLSAGAGLEAPGGVTYTNKAIYAQGYWTFNDQWSMSAGLRYTDDETKGWTRETVYYFPSDLMGGYFPAGAVATSERKLKTSSEEPTWLLGVEYKPNDDTMLYAKYSRGYRQGSVNLASAEAWAVHGPEQVDTYEVGSKFSFEGSIPGTLNLALFYNDFKDQQVQFGYLRDNGVASTSILNAGASTIWGLELDGLLHLTNDLTFSYAYAYLNTNVDDMVIPQAPYPAGVGQFSGTSTAEGEPLSYSPEHSVVLGLNYHLPVDESLGSMVASLTYVYNDDSQAVSKASSVYAVVPSYELVNLNFNWRNVGGSPVDLSAFVTNLFDEEYIATVAGNWQTGMELGRVGMPRMFGARIRYNF